MHTTSTIIYYKILDKFVVSRTQTGKYKYNMTLNITRVSAVDFGQYRCVVSNSQGLTKGVLSVFGET
jgi:hypothetical protein